MTGLLVLIALLVLIFCLAIFRAPLALWAGVAALAAFNHTVLASSGGWGFWSVVAWLPALVLGVLSIPGVRRKFIVEPTFSMVRKILPKVSETEQEALEAGTTGWDAELFSGRPDWAKLRAVAPIELAPDEQAFLDGAHRRALPDGR